MLSGGIPAPVNMPLPSEPTMTLAWIGSRAPRARLRCAESGGVAVVHAVARTRHSTLKHDGRGRRALTKRFLEWSQPMCPETRLPRDLRAVRPVVRRPVGPRLGDAAEQFHTVHVHRDPEARAVVRIQPALL